MFILCYFVCNMIHIKETQYLNGKGIKFDDFLTSTDFTIVLH